MLKSFFFWSLKYLYDIYVDKDGFLEIFDVLVFGIVVMKLGVGRVIKEDKIDFEVGIILYKKINEIVKKGDKLFIFYLLKEINFELEKELLSVYKIGLEKVENKIIIDRLK